MDELGSSCADATYRSVQFPVGNGCFGSSKGFDTDPFAPANGTDASMAATHSWNVGLGGSTGCFGNLWPRNIKAIALAPPVAGPATAPSRVVKRAGHIVFISG